MPCSERSSCCRRSIRFSMGGCVEKSDWSTLLTRTGTMKKAFMRSSRSASRRSRWGSCFTWLEIFTSADDSALGRPVTMAAPRSAANSR